MLAVYIWIRFQLSRDGEVNVEDDSCMSFELQEDSNMIFSHSLIENRECHRSCDQRLKKSDCWTKNKNLLPTWNIIDELFGQDDWGENDDKTPRVNAIHNLCGK
ncbi:unnamed protein product [Eruca vesicaria subsp. sativa]|uniref:Apple domain-containing protein n=1 Tax=Eruca vesicaria subsp. sativa TaxID=29727 RepID=A0ABC8L9A1_ERUVS|nr:unnamed protein product [Eruca vesicaria subsp. sativa]